MMKKRGCRFEGVKAGAEEINLVFVPLGAGRIRDWGVEREKTFGRWNAMRRDYWQPNKICFKHK